MNMQFQKNTIVGLEPDTCERTERRTDMSVCRLRKRRIMSHLDVQTFSSITRMTAEHFLLNAHNTEMEHH